MPHHRKSDGYIGAPLKRVEDERLITGRGRYAGDIQVEGLLHLAVFRSPLPHAKIRSLQLDAARAMPGVVAVWTTEDLGEADTMHEHAPQGIAFHDRPVLAEREVNYVGDGIAAVIAEDPYVAADAVEAITADLRPLPAVGNVLTAMQPDAPRVHSRSRSNITGERVHGFGDIDAAFGDHAVSVIQRLTTARVAGASMEPRSVTAEYDAATKTLTVHTSTQAVFTVRGRIAGALDMDPENVHVIAADVGGGFGEKGPAYPEEILVALAARRLNRPVRWIATRSEHTATTALGHGTVFDLELAADRDGKLRGLRGRVFHDLGAYVGSAAIYQPGGIIAHMVSAYVLPAMHVEQHLVFTNTVPGGFIRGGGRPIGNFAIERLMDLLANKLELDPVEFRRRNLIQPDQLPYETGLGEYDSGDYPRLLEAAAKAIDYERAPRGKHEDKLFGAAVVCCVESTGFGGYEPARVRIERDGRAHLYLGSTPQGQSHETVARQVAAERLGWPLDKVTVIAGDTRWVPEALITAGSRSAAYVGNAAAQAALAARQQVLENAAEYLHVYPSQVVIQDGSVGIEGAPETLVPVEKVIPAEGIDVLEVFEPEMAIAYSSACHAAQVAVDSETGHVDVVRYVIASDHGRSINPIVVEGQIQGGFAHGLGYALYEEAIYKPDGQFVSSNFLDYTIAGAPEMAAPLDLLEFETSTPANPEGFKGAGESGTIPVPAAIASAVEDALRAVKPDLVVDHIPITPLRIHELLSSR